MRTIHEYIDLARQRNGFSSDRKVSIALGTDNFVTQLRRGRSWPSDAMMLKLADLAGIPADEALLDLCRWRTDGTRAATVYATLSERLGRVAMALLIAGLCLAPGALPPAEAGEQAVNREARFLPLLYIMRADDAGATLGGCRP